MDVRKANGVLLLARDIFVKKVKTLEMIRDAGIYSVTVDTDFDGGLWDGNGNLIVIKSDGDIDIPAFDTRANDTGVMEAPPAEPQKKALKR